MNIIEMVCNIIFLYIMHTNINIIRRRSQDLEINVELE
jgi:hypothetical protein